MKKNLQYLCTCTFTLLFVSCMNDTADTQEGRINSGLNQGNAGGSDVENPPASTDLEELQPQIRQNESASVREITIATDAGAKCSLHVDSSEETMLVWADDSGLVHLWAAETSLPKGFLLECDELRGKGRYTFDLSNPATFSPAIPRVSPVERTELPALSNDPMKLSNAELVEAGYPPRPDRATAPEFYAKWLELVSKPMTLVEPHFVERPDIRLGPIRYANSAIWAGSVLRDSTPSYVWVLGAWPVNAYSNPYGSSSSRVARWVGLDGYGTNSVMQDGILYDNVGGVGTYSALYEYYPNPAVLNTSMVVSPFHFMTFWAWEGNASCGGGGTGYGCFWYQNNTTGVTAGTFKVRAPVPFTRSTAEAVVERVGGSPVSQFQFYPGSYLDFAAVDSASGWHGQTNDPFTLVSLVNSSLKKLVMPITDGSENRVWFYWQKAK